MTVSTYFFDNQPIYQNDWSFTLGKMLYDGVVCGVGNDLFVYGDASGMQVKVRSGMMHIKGHYYHSDAEQILAIAAAPGTAGQSRYDLIVGEVNWTNKTFTIKVVTGTAATTPALPALTRTSTIWQVPIASLTVDYGNTNVAANAVLDRRTWALGTFTIPLIIGNAATIISTGAAPIGIVIPNRSKIVRFYLVTDVTGSIVIDLWKDLYGNYPPTVADTICNSSHKPALSAAQTSWRTVWNEATYINSYGTNWPGNVFSLTDLSTNYYYLLPNVDSVSSIKQVNLTLQFAKMISE